MTDKKVTVYSSTGCPHCQAAKQYLKDNGVAFTEKNIAEDENAAKELSDKGAGSVPVIVIGEKTITGFEQGEIKDSLGLS